MQSGGTQPRKSSAAIREGVRYLKSVQRPDGSWADVETEAKTGTTSLVMLALLTAGEKPDAPHMRKALEYLRGFGPNDLRSTYAVALQTMVFAAAEPERDQLRMANNVSWLEPHRSNPVTRFIGRGRGVIPTRSTAVPATTPIRSMRFWACTRRARRASRSTRAFGTSPAVTGKNASGSTASWAYTPDAGPQTASMTCAGISSLVVSGLRRYEGAEFVEGAAIHNCGKGAANKNLQAGINWLANHFYVGQNLGLGQQWKYYYLYGLERAGRLAGVRFFGQYDWYRLGAEELVHEQNKLSGLWKGALIEADYVLATSFAVLFLAKGRAPVLINKLRHPPSDDWNNDPDDVRNIVNIVSRDWKNLLTWQVVDPEAASVAELLQAPIVFFNGHRARRSRRLRG